MDLSNLNPFNTKTANGIHYYQFLTPGGDGSIECLLSAPTSTQPINNIAVICHPHPLFDGTMHNKVVFTIAKTLNKHNIPVLRFNFRGVEKSEGQYAEGIGEKEDLRVVTELFQKLYPGKSLWLAGFSFGSYIAASMQQTLAADRLITIAPAVTSFDFNAFPAPECPWLLVQGLADEVIDADKVLSWANHLTKPPTIVTMEGTSHFFHRRLVDLANVIEDFIPETNDH